MLEQWWINFQPEEYPWLGESVCTGTYFIGPELDFGTISCASH